MNTTFRFTRESTKPTQWVTEYQHQEVGLSIALSVCIGVADSSPRAGTLELHALKHVIGMLQARADVLTLEQASG